MFAESSPPRAACFTEPVTPSGRCAHCGVPLDSQHFDESSITAIPNLGTEVVLARFDLPPQYCGVLQHLAQFTDLHARRPDEAETQGLEWTLLSNGRPFSPFVRLRTILNPWGFGSFRTDLRLSEGTTLELVVRRTGETTASRPGLRVRRVGGRITGQYWYDRAYGEVIRDAR